MLLKKLRLKNFLSYKSLELDFSLGSIVFIGENGAGKSSILDAILFALYRENNRGRGLQGLIKRGEKSAEVELIFSTGNKEYKIVRELSFDKRRIQSDVRLYEIDGNTTRLIAYKTDADRLIVQKTGIDKNVFMTSIYVRQGEISRLIEMRPAERKEIMSKLLGIEDLEKAYVNMREVLNYYEKNRREIEGSLKMKNMVEKQLNEVNERISDLKEKIIKQEHLINIKREELKKLEEQKRILDDKKKIYQELVLKKEILSGKIENISRNLKELEEDIERAKNAREEITRLKDAVEELERIEKAYEIRRQIEILTKERDDIVKKINEYNSYLSRIREIEKKASEYKILLERQRGLQSKLSVEEHLKSYLVEVSNDYQNKIDEYKSISNYIDELKDRFSHYSLRFLDDFSNFKEVFYNRLDVLEGKIKDLQKKIESIKGEMSTLEGVIREKSELLNKLRVSKDKCPLCGSRLTEKHKTFLLKKYDEEIIALEARKKSLEAKLSELDLVFQKYVKERDILIKIDVDEVLEKVKKLRELNVEVNEKKELLERIKEKLNEIRREKSVLEELEKKVKELEPIYNEFIGLNAAVSKIDLDELNKNLEEVDKKIKELYLQLETLGKPEIPEEDRLQELRELRVKYYKLQVLASELDKLLEKRNGYVKSLELYKDERVIILRKIGELGFDEELYMEVQEKYQDCLNEVTKLGELLKGMREKISEYSDNRRKLSETLKMLEKEEQKLKDIINYISFLKEIRDVFSKDGLQQVLRRNAVPLIQKYVREFATLFEFDFYGIKITDDYDVYIIDSEGERPIDGASGGEKVAIALALRLAIARVFQGSKLSMLMLDEPTQYLDENRRRFLVNILKKLFSGDENIFPQLILVTHDRELEDVADVLYKVEKIGSTSRVKKVLSQ